MNMINLGFIDNLITLICQYKHLLTIYIKMLFTECGTPQYGKMTKRNSRLLQVDAEK